jgi:chemotaxis regulatin CheY-phosphate phosphatase CheZ
MNTEILQFPFQRMTESTIIARIVGGEAKQFVVEIISSQDFQDNTGHVLAGMVIPQAFEGQNLLMKVEIGIDPMCGDPYSASAKSLVGNSIIGKFGSDLPL